MVAAVEVEVLQAAVQEGQGVRRAVSVLVALVEAQEEEEVEEAQGVADQAVAVGAARVDRAVQADPAQAEEQVVVEEV